ncbi:AMMECR1 domain-containing protein [Trichlorobacter lovleyi]|uniref:AMMECR1 domain-containing protein n=1 Tax=Trichlorobacter lovleyi TaxID=313985 RepID=UPI00223F62FE|nr:AMMECR1 domain-containing protein [Trichlorobacter lovleyi]QOX78347.1 AMMECR1 domain-containing protein [Trichlorobacter lovleyi]
MKGRLALLTLCICLLTLPASGTTFSLPDRTALLEYAREVMVSHLEKQPAPGPPAITAGSQRACFVTFFVKRQVMACFGSFTPRHTTLFDEISDNIRLALKNDRRASRLTPELARSASIQITFPGQPQPVSDWRLVDPQQEGLLVEASDGRGVAIVPGEARTAHYAWRSALQRLGLSERSSGVRLYRFKAEYIRSQE